MVDLRPQGLCRPPEERTLCSGCREREREMEMEMEMEMERERERERERQRETFP
jgi:hypothetical protein